MTSTNRMSELHDDPKYWTSVAWSNGSFSSKWHQDVVTLSSRPKLAKNWLRGKHDYQQQSLSNTKIVFYEQRPLSSINRMMMLSLFNSTLADSSYQVYYWHQEFDWSPFPRDVQEHGRGYPLTFTTANRRILHLLPEATFIC